MAGFGCLSRYAHKDTQTHIVLALFQFSFFYILCFITVNPTFCLFTINRIMSIRTAIIWFLLCCHFFTLSYNLQYWIYNSNAYGQVILPCLANIDNLSHFSSLLVGSDIDIFSPSVSVGR